ncbi:MAG: ATP-dependent Clp protease adapter ClpS [Frankiaceae bacterium]
MRPGLVVCDHVGVTSTETERVVRTEPDELVETDRPWVTVVWNDPVNLMTYVTYVFQKLFGYDLAKATELMMQVHNEGKAVVSGGSREAMERDVSRLHAAGLWATLQHD